VTLLLYKKVHY